MLKNDLVLALSEMDYYKNQAGAVINDVFRVIAEALTKGEKVTIRGFGTFEVTERAAREGRNPQTGETMVIEASKAPKFKAGKALKDIVNS